MIELIVEYEERLDKYISSNTEITRNDIQELIKSNKVLVDQKIVNKCSFLVKEKQIITITEIMEKEEYSIEPWKLNLDIVYEDHDLVIINKPSGLTVHPAPGHKNKTLINALVYHYQQLSDINGVLRPGIVHRIDKDTSGLLIIAKNNKIHQLLSNMLKDHLIRRSYLALAIGTFKDKNLMIKLPIARDVKNRQRMTITHENSKDAITNVLVLQERIVDNLSLSLVKCDLETGRTHQIRVHLSYIKHPIYGDPIYGKTIDDYGQRLHAYKLEFIHPITKKEIKVFAKPEFKYFGIDDKYFEQIKKMN